MKDFNIQGEVSFEFNIDVESDSFENAEIEAIQQIKDFFKLDRAGTDQTTADAEIGNVQVLQQCVLSSCDFGYYIDKSESDKNNGMCDECQKIHSNPF